MQKLLGLFFVLTILLAYSCATTKKDAGLLVTKNLAASLNALASGSQVKLAPGEYFLDEVILLSGKENIIIDGNGALLVMNSLESDVIHLTGCSNIQLLNFKATHIEPSGPTGCTGNVIYVDDSSDILIQNCDLNGSGIVGIAAYNTDNLLVEDSHIHENSEYAIIYQGPSLYMTGNIIEKNGNDNVIYFSYVEKGGMLGWPPEDKIAYDTQKTGLVMKKNTFLRD
jgi:parallel beta-helix repeat protein